MRRYAGGPRTTSPVGETSLQSIRALQAGHEAVEGAEIVRMPFVWSIQTAVSGDIWLAPAASHSEAVIVHPVKS